MRTKRKRYDDDDNDDDGDDNDDGDEMSENMVSIVGEREKRGGNSRTAFLHSHGRLHQNDFWKRRRKTKRQAILVY